jgi:hypothetical protein
MITSLTRTQQPIPPNIKYTYSILLGSMGSDTCTPNPCQNGGIVLDLLWTHFIYVLVLKTKTEFIVKVSISMFSGMHIYLSFTYLRYLLDNLR